MNKKTDEIAHANLLCGAYFAQVLSSLGLETIYFSPGSRSTPLIIGIERYSNIQLIPVLDERSAGFIALGQSKQQNKPVGLICTSGSALTHWFPAITEASHAGTPLLLFSADRPPELQNCGAGQTIYQENIFGSFVRQFHQLDVPQSSEEFKKQITTALHTAFLEATGLNPGPVHLNFPFREPFLPASPVIIDQELKDHNLPSREISYPDSTIGISEEISSATRPLIIAGQDVTKKDIEPWLENPSVPILCDSLSSTRLSGSNNTILRYENLLRDPQFVENCKPDLIITLGPLPTSKTLRNWIKGLSAQRIVIEPRGINVDPIQSESKDFQIGFDQLEKINVPPPEQGWTEYWTEGERDVQTKLDRAFEEELPAFEGKLAYLLSLHLPSDANLFVANSMPIRDLEWFWKKSTTSRRLFGNRGVNGIDGTLGTALGMAQETSAPNFLLTGELAFLHDSNALLFANQFKGNLTVFVINNDGGGIFENLPIAKEPEFEKCFATPQSFDLSSLCKAFHVDYSLLSSWSQIIEKLIKPRDRGIEVIEIRTNRKQDRLTRNKLLALTPWKDA